MIRLIFYIGMIALLFYVGVLYSSTALVLLGLAAACFALFAYLFLFFQLFLLRFSMELPVAMTEAGKEVQVKINIENRGFFPVTKIIIKMGCRSKLTGKKKSVRFYGMAGNRGKTALTASIREQECGTYQIKIKNIRIYDLSGYFYITRFLREKKEWIVMPKMQEMVVQVTEKTRHFAGESEYFDDRVGGNDTSETFQIREFRPGDKIQSIHWKMTAKTDNLMVREFSQPLGCAVIVFLDVAGKKKIKPGFLDLCASVSYSLLQQKCPHYLVWYCGKRQDLLRVRVEKEEDFYQGLLLLFSVIRVKETKNLVSMYREKYRAETAITHIYITQSMKIMVNDVLVKEEKQKAEDVELIV